MPNSEPTRHPGSFIDPAGCLYEANGNILRGIRPGFAAFYAGLLEDQAIKELLAREIVETEVVHEGLEGYPLTLKHRTLSPVSFPYEWTSGMLRDAANLTLDICIKLTERDRVLQDASPWNIVFEGTRPIFVDFTSIVQQDPNLLWAAYDQFCRLFLYPLALFAYLPGRIVRSFLTDALNGVSPDEVAKLLPARSVLRMRWLSHRLHLPRFILRIVRRMGQERALNRMSGRLSPSRQARTSFLASLRRDVKGISLQTGRSHWAKYYVDIATFFQVSKFNAKQSTVARLVDELRPRSVVDIGCNRGGYSIIAAMAGARVVCFDTDDDSVGLLYLLAREKQLNILPLVMDVLNPSPAGGWRARQFPSAPTRFKSEMAMALALVHHLAITQRQTFERIVPALADYAGKWLLTEFVPLDDPRSQELLVTHRRDLSWYSLPGLLAVLRESFREVQLFPSFPVGRTLILCTR
jgi:hypothetical protein